MCLAAVLHPDSLGELQRSPGPLAAIGGGVLLLRGREGRRVEGREKGSERKEAGKKQGRRVAGKGKGQGERG